MQVLMRYLGAAAVGLLLGGGAPQAGNVNVPMPPAMPEPPAATPGEDHLVVGIGVICNTGQQAEQYVRLRADGAALVRAMDAVNKEAREPRACGMAAVAFQRDKTMDTQRVNGKLVSIVRISVLAGYDGERWAPVPAMVQYAIMEADGLEV